jgi:hypothetical protein
MNDEPGAEFAELCRRVCTALESGTVTAAELQRLFGQIVAAATLLPSVLGDQEGDIELDPDRQRTVRRLQHHGISTIPAGYYFTYTDPCQGPNTPLSLPEAAELGSFYDDLSDIYSGLAEGLQAWEDGREEEAIWQWRFGFHSVWGRDITDALRVLWQVRHDNQTDKPDD